MHFFYLDMKSTYSLIKTPFSWSSTLLYSCSHFRRNDSLTDPIVFKEQVRYEIGQKMVGLTGLEPVTLRLSSACSNQLSYRPRFSFSHQLLTFSMILIAGS